MKKFYKISGILAGIFLGVGLLFTMIGVILGAKGIIVLTKEHGFQIIEDFEQWEYKDMDMVAFENIYIHTNTADVDIVRSTDGRYGVDVSLNGDDSTVQVYNEDKTLMIVDEGSDMGFTVNLLPFTTSYDCKIVVYVPENVELHAIVVNCVTGDVNVDGVSICETMNIGASVGDVEIVGGRYQELQVKTEVGDLEAERITVKKNLNVSTDIGDVEMQGLLQCNMDISTNLGDIDMTVGMSSDSYYYDVSTDVGDVEIFDKEVEGLNGTLGGNASGEYKMVIRSNMGSITVE